MRHSVFHRVFFASPSKWELANLMMRGFIRVSNNYIREGILLFGSKIHN